jgi:hypothetical protein
MRSDCARFARSTTPVSLGEAGLVVVDVPGSVARYAPGGAADGITGDPVELVATDSTVDVIPGGVEIPEAGKFIGVEVSRYATVEGAKVDLDVAVSRYADGGSADVPGVEVSRYASEVIADTVIGVGTT